MPEVVLELRWPDGEASSFYSPSTVVYEFLKPGDRLSIAELEQALAQLGRQRLFNTSGQSYRALGAAAVQAMDDQAALAALAADGKLIKRPFLIANDGRILTGFKEPEWLDLLG